MGTSFAANGSHPHTFYEFSHHTTTIGHSRLAPTILLGKPHIVPNIGHLGQPCVARLGAHHAPLLPLFGGALASGAAVLAGVDGGGAWQ